MPRTAETVNMAHMPVPRKASFMPAQLVRTRAPMSTLTGRSLPALRSRMKITTVATNMIGVLNPRMYRQSTVPQGSAYETPTSAPSTPPLQVSAPAIRAPAASGPMTSPMLPVERCMDMNSPRLSGKRRASRPRAGGCHNALPMEPRAMAHRIRA